MSLIRFDLIKSENEPVDYIKRNLANLDTQIEEL